MSVNISQTSRLLFDTLLSVDGYEFWDTLDLPTFVSHIGDLKHKVIATDRLDILADYYYADATMWWVIAWANGMEVIPTALNVDDVITIPDPSYIKSGFFPQNTNG